MAGTTSSGGFESPEHYDALMSLLADWRMTPKGLRQPRSQAQWAEQHDLRPETVSRWITSGKIDEIQRRKSAGIVTPADINAIIEAHKQKALEGNVPSTKMLFELCGVTQLDTSDDEQLPDDLSGMSAEDLAAIARGGE